jgi:hypothetical protein
MFRKLSISLVTVASVLVTMVPADAAKVKNVNCVQNVCTRIILKWKNTNQGVCFAHNSNNQPVTAYIDVYPAGTFVNYPVTWTVIASLPKLGDEKVFGWDMSTYDWHTFSCLVKSVN